MTKYPTYEPGEPEDIARKKAKESKRHAHKKALLDFWGWFKWVLLVLLVLSGVVFGLNRMVHSSNEDNRKYFVFYQACATQGNRVVEYQKHTVCVEGVVTETGNTDTKPCIARGELVTTDNHLYVCIKGRVVAVMS